MARPLDSLRNTHLIAASTRPGAGPPPVHKEDPLASYRDEASHSDRTRRMFLRSGFIAGAAGGLMVMISAPAAISQLT